MKLLLILLLISSGVLSRAHATAPVTMNGIGAAQYAGFETNWKLVTVRFRNDTKEMRFTYANDVAWNALKSGATNYPDGAVFAKIGVATKPDPAFVSSAVPSGARRTQFMVRDKKKYADYDGWGYALFDEKGELFPGEEKANTVACSACHRLVPERGEVFSEFMNFPGLPSAKPQAGLASKILFVDRDRKTLPAALRSRLPKDVKSLRLITGDLSRHVFFGTLDEIRPTLVVESLRANQPAALVSEDGQQFSIVYRLPNQGTCTKGESHLMNVHTVPQSNGSLYESDFCEAK